MRPPYLLIDRLQPALSHPISVRLKTSISESFHLFSHETLYFSDSGDDIVDFNAVTIQEDFDAMSTIRRLLECAPPHALCVVPKRDDLFDGIQDVKLRPSRMREVPVDDSHWFLTGPDDIPGAKVAMAHDLVGFQRGSEVCPLDLAVGLVVPNCIVVSTQQRGEAGQAVIAYDFAPGALARFAVDERENLATLLIESTDTWRIGEVSLLQVPQKLVDRRRPPARRTMDRAIDPDDWMLLVRAELFHWLSSRAEVLRRGGQVSDCPRGRSGRPRSPPAISRQGWRGRLLISTPPMTAKARTRT